MVRGLTQGDASGNRCQAFGASYSRTLAANRSGLQGKASGQSLRGCKEMLAQSLGMFDLLILLILLLLANCQKAKTKARG